MSDSHVSYRDHTLMCCLLADLSDGTEVFISTEGENVIFRVRGPLITIVNCGDQLAWLYAMSKAKIDGVVPVEHVPKIVRMSESSATSNSRSIRAVCLEINSKKISRGATASVRERKLWSRILGSDFGITSGYPIYQRPAEYSGLEIPPALLFDTIGGGVSLEDSGYHIVLHGSQKSLVLVTFGEDTYLWHEICDDGPPCSCDVNWADDIGWIGNIDIVSHDFCSRLESGRHFVQICGQQSSSGRQYIVYAQTTYALTLARNLLDGRLFFCMGWRQRLRPDSKPCSYIGTKQQYHLNGKACFYI